MANKNKYTVELPLIVEASDPHDFDPLTYVLSELLGKFVSYEEIDTSNQASLGIVDLYLGGTGNHYAVVYTGHKDQDVDDLIKEFLGEERIS